MNHVVNARLVVGSGNVLTRAVVAGLGIAQTFEYHVAAELARFSSSHGLWLTQR